MERRRTQGAPPDQYTNSGRPQASASKSEATLLRSRNFMERATDARAQSTAKALVIGINDYGSPRNNLPSCVKDAQDFADMLRTFPGFDNPDIRILFDAQAT